MLTLLYMTELLSIVETKDWSNKEWVRKYHREKRRQERGLKRHPNILEDGTRWGDTHPWGKFSSYQEYIENKRKYYKPAIPIITCSICNKTYRENAQEKHDNSKAHKLVLQALKTHNVVV